MCVVFGGNSMMGLKRDTFVLTVQIAAFVNGS